jgi:hypothetical protein
MPNAAETRRGSRFALPLALIALGVFSVLGGFGSLTMVCGPAGVVGLGLLIAAAVPMSPRRTKLILIAFGLLLMVAALIACWVFGNQQTEVGGLIAVGCLFFGGVPGLILLVLGAFWRPASGAPVE